MWKRRSDTEQTIYKTTFSEGLNSVETIETSVTSAPANPSFQKDLIVWKPFSSAFCLYQSWWFSEGLNSVETEI